MVDNKEGWEEFINLCAVTKDNKILAELYDLFLTIEEKENLAMRFLIIRSLLKQKKTQREIASDLNVSIAKITRGSNELKRTSKKLISYLLTKMDSTAKR